MSNQLTIHDFARVQEALWAARSKWDNIGTRLKLDVRELECIETEGGMSLDKKFNLMIQTRLKKIEPCTWRDLYDALNHPTVAMSDVACKLVPYIPPVAAATETGYTDGVAPAASVTTSPIVTGPQIDSKAPTTGGEVLTPNDAVEVLEALLPALNQSYELGLRLKLKPHDVKSIHATVSEPRKRLLQIVLEFLNQIEPRPTWRVIVDALKSSAVNLPQLAMTVEAAHFPDAIQALVPEASVSSSQSLVTSSQPGLSSPVHGSGASAFTEVDCQPKPKTEDTVVELQRRPESPQPSPMTTMYVQAKIKRFEKRFIDLKKAARRCLVKRKISVEQVIDALTSMSPDDNDEHKQFLKQNLSDLCQSTDIPELIGKLSILHWDYLSYQLLDYLIKEFGLEVRGEMEAYKLDLQRFRQKTPLALFCQCQKKRKRKPSEEFQNMVAEFDWPNEVSLEVVEQFRQEYACHYKLRDCAMIVAEIHPGCFVITWFIPESMVKKLREDIPNLVLKKFGVVSLEIAGVKVYPPIQKSAAVSLPGPGPSDDGAAEKSPTQPKAIQTQSNLSPEEDYPFVEKKSEDFFCPVTFGLLLQPHLTSCCGKHLSEESATRIQGDGGRCPLCKSPDWSTLLDKHVRRQVKELHVFCRHKEKGCRWKGELSDFTQHVQSCQFRYTQVSTQGRTELHDAAERGDVEADQGLLSTSVNINSRTEDEGDTALLVDSRRGDVEAVRPLFKAGGAVFIPDKSYNQRKSHEERHSNQYAKKAIFYLLCVSVLVAAVVVGRLLDTSARTVLIRNDLPVPPTPMTYSPKQLGGMPLGPLNKQQDAVVEAFQHGWKAYKKYAWGRDELKPISRGSHEWLELGLTLVDSLDTMWLMGLSQEFDEARKWVKEEMVIGVDKDVNLFETTNRIMGGLLSTYHLTQDQLFLDKAKELGDMLLPCFKSPSGIPFSDINLKTGHSHAPAWGPDSSVSEVSTIQLEFRDLSKLTSDLKYQMAVDKVMEKLQSLQMKDHLVPLFINAETGNFTPGTLTLGARADTYYEYLFKQWIQNNKKDNRYRQWFLDSMSGVTKRLLRYSGRSKWIFIGEELRNGSFYPKMDHLVCYLPGTLALAAHNGLSKKSFMRIAKDLMYTCYRMYKDMPTGLSPEIVHFNMDPGATKDIYVEPLNCHNILRPETVESLFYLYRFTNETKYRSWGWKILQAFNNYARLKDGYSSINNVTNTTHLDHRDKMEGFFLGQTLKYLFLLFADDHSIISLDHWVLNTAAHPLPIWDSY